MNTGYVITILFKIVTVYVGVLLAVRPCAMRWENRWAKGIFAVLVAVAMFWRGGNTFYVKSSPIESTIVAAQLFLILLLFYDINVWQLCVRNFFYWCHLMIFEYFVVYLICYIDKVTFAEYNVNYIPGREIPWSGLHLMVEVLMSGGLLAVAYWMRGRSFIQCRKKRIYKYLLILLLVEWLFFENIIYTNEYFYKRTVGSYILLLFLFLLFLLIACMLFVLLNAYYDAKQQERLEAMNGRMVSEQYASLNELYQEKRRQFHDMRNQLVMIDGYLKEDAPEAAKRYVEELLEVSAFSKKQSYTGILVIDFMINYKLDQAKAQGINVHLSLDVQACPVKDRDFCVILGNLMDNAIEATAALEAPRRQIRLSMKMSGNIFVLEICNPYEGKRRRIDGRYETTKEDRSSHELGLASVQNIVDGADGLMEIHDDGKNFDVVVSLFTAGN